MAEYRSARLAREEANRRGHAAKLFAFAFVFLAVLIWSSFSAYRIAYFLAIFGSIFLVHNAGYYLHRHLANRIFSQDGFTMLEFYIPRGVFGHPSYSWPWWCERCSYDCTVSSRSGECFDTHLWVLGIFFGLIFPKVDYEIWLEPEESDDGNNQDIENELKALRDLTSLKHLRLDYSKMTDAELEHLARLESLESVDLSHTGIADDGLRYLKRIPNLKSISMFDTKISDSGLEHLKGLTNLNELVLSGTQISDAGLVHLKQIATLEVIALPKTITDEGREMLRTALPNCDIFHAFVADPAKIDA